MGINFRKSINLGGGFRINLSKSGIGYSWGVKGFRVTKQQKALHAPLLQFQEQESRMFMNPEMQIIVHHNAVQIPISSPFLQLIIIITIHRIL